MKKVILSLLLASALFGESEDFYKSKYEYLTEKLKNAESGCWSATLKAMELHMPYERYSRADQQRDDDNKRNLCNIKSDTIDKVMDLRFKMIEDLKNKPEWFTYGDKK